jgi:biotin-(acetyl-CoA carboxylase) ligase
MSRMRYDCKFSIGDRVIVYPQDTKMRGVVVGFDEQGDLVVEHDGHKHTTTHYRRYALPEGIYDSPLYKAMHDE